MKYLNIDFTGYYLNFKVHMGNEIKSLRPLSKHLNRSCVLIRQLCNFNLGQNQFKISPFNCFGRENVYSDG